MLQLLKNKIKAVGNNIVVKPVNIEIPAQGVIIPDVGQHSFFYGTIQSVGEKCNKVIREGCSVFLKRLKGQKVEQEGQNTYIFKEEDILLIRWRGQWHPIGNKILIMRDVEEEQLASGIIISACRPTKDQTLFGVVLNMGLIHVQAKPDSFVTKFDYPVNIGDKVKIKEWSQEIQEVGLDKMNCIIVKPSQLDYKIENE